MRFHKTAIDGVVTIELNAAEDARGFFARTYCDEEFAQAGIAMQPRQMNVSHNVHALTLRGLHYQDEPHGESKLIQCIRGRVFDVVVDLRRTSPTYREWEGIELAPEARRSLFVPAGCAHGFLTLEDSSDLLYVMGYPFVADAGRGVRWNDPAFDITWTHEPKMISPRDASYPDFEP
jgi:dTDP-4-dehydrorhamnose 3,5-epimerase